MDRAKFYIKKLKQMVSQGRVKRSIAIVTVIVIAICVLLVHKNVQSFSNNENQQEESTTPEEQETGEEDAQSDSNIPQYLKQYNSIMSDKGIIVLYGNSQGAKIYEADSNDSKVTGYLIEDSIVTVKKKKGDFYLIKSGKIKGYVKAKNVATGDQAENLIIDGGLLLAIPKKDDVSLTKTSNSKTSVGKVYKGESYQVLGFSNNHKKIKLQRTENVTGWTKVKKIKFSLDITPAFTKKEYKAYIKEKEQEMEEQMEKAISSMNISGTSLTATILKIIAHNESGNYVAARNSLPQYSGEKTITVGAWQWYGERAHNLLRKIVEEEEEAKELIYDSFTGSKKRKKSKTKKLYNDIIGDESWEENSREFSDEELLAVKSLLGTETGRDIQNTQAKSDVNRYISAMKSYGITNKQVIAYGVDLFWQSPTNAKAIINAVKSECSSLKELNGNADGLSIIHKAAMKNSTMGQFSGRRKYTYSACSKIEIKITKNSKKKNKADKRKNKKNSSKPKKDDSEDEVSNSTGEETATKSSSTETSEKTTEKATEKVTEKGTENSTEKVTAEAITTEASGE